MWVAWCFVCGWVADCVSCWAVGLFVGFLSCSGGLISLGFGWVCFGLCMLGYGWCFWVVGYSGVCVMVVVSLGVLVLGGWYNMIFGVLGLICCCLDGGLVDTWVCGFGL